MCVAGGVGLVGVDTCPRGPVSTDTCLLVAGSWGRWSQLHFSYVPVVVSFKKGKMSPVSRVSQADSEGGSSKSRSREILQRLSGKVSQDQSAAAK